MSIRIVIESHIRDYSLDISNRKMTLSLSSRARIILSHIKAEAEKMENPYPITAFNHEGYEEFRKSILKLLEEE